MKLFKNLFKTKDIEEESKDSSIQKSICSLMIEVAYADNQLDESELKAMANSLRKLNIEKEEIQEIVDATLAKSKESISFYEHTRILNDQLDYDQKKEVLNSVWAIAFADGEMDKHEERLIRRIADLLYLNHKDFINAKLNQKETNENKASLPSLGLVQPETKQHILKENPVELSAQESSSELAQDKKNSKLSQDNDLEENDDDVKDLKAKIEKSLANLDQAEVE